jgi:hypothetical protein
MDPRTNADVNISLDWAGSDNKEDPVDQDGHASFNDKAGERTVHRCGC